MKLVVQQGNDAGREIRLERGRLVLGRGSDCDLVLQETEASRRHAELRRFGDQWLIVDLGSTNGTFLGDLRLQPNQTYAVSPGVPVTVGRTRFVLQEEPQAVAVAGPPSSYGEEPAGGEGVAGAAVSPFWEISAWICRIVVLVGCGMLVIGALRDWARIQVQLPLLGTVLDRTFSGRDSGQAWLFFGLAAVAGLLVILDIGARRWGLAAGLGEALLSAAVAATIGVDLYRYYQVGTQKFLGISLLDVFTQYARNAVHLTVKPGIYLVAAGLAALLLGGLLRLILAATEPSEQ
jgi:hypothetical protein